MALASLAVRRGCSAHHAEVLFNQPGPIQGKPSMRKSTSKSLTVIGFALAYTVCTIQLCSAKDDDEIVFECRYIDNDIHDHVVADSRGITITQYRGNQFVRTYTTNEKDGSHTGYYRKNRSEIAWGHTYFLSNKPQLIDSFIDRKTGILKNTVNDPAITEIARCTESTP